MVFCKLYMRGERRGKRSRQVGTYLFSEVSKYENPLYVKGVNKISAKHFKTIYYTIISSKETKNIFR